jgi:hypothetical protein
MDIWQSPYEQSFLAIASYFIDEGWRLREVVLGFEPIEGTHTGQKIGEILMGVLQKHGVQDCLYAMTTDKASINSTAAAYVQLYLESQAAGTHIPCLAHVLQLSLGELMSNLNAAATNESEVEYWNDTMAESVNRFYGVAKVVEKVMTAQIQFHVE